MPNYTYVQANSGSAEDRDTGIILEVDIIAQVPEGYLVDQSVLDSAVERALDYIFDEGFEENDS